MFTNQFKHVHQFKITLKGTKPPIWRRIQVPDNYSFEDLHAAIQNVMDWEVYAGSSYEFHVINPSTGLAEAIGCSCFGFSRFAGIDEPAIAIADYFAQPKTKADYTSKHETTWKFTVELEKVLPADEFEIYPTCIKGKRASPPEDCGGVDEYQEMLKAIGKPNSGRCDVLGDDFDPEYFDPDSIFFTSGSGNPPLPEDLPDRLMEMLKKLDSNES